MELLHVTHAWSRTLFGGTQYNPPSRFLDEIPEELVTEVGGRRQASRGGRTYSAGGGSFARGGRGRTGRPGRRHRGADLRSGRPSIRSSIDEGRERIVENALASRDRPPVTTGAESAGLRVGDDVHHATFGEGVIIDIDGAGDKAEATIRFAGRRREAAPALLGAVEEDVSPDPADGTTV